MPSPPGRSPSPCRRPKALKTRETLMTVIDTLSLRNEDVVAKLIDVLNELVRDPKRDVADLLWGRTDKP